MPYKSVSARLSKSRNDDIKPVNAALQLINSFSSYLNAFILWVSFLIPNETFGAVPGCLAALLLILFVQSHNFKWRIC